MDIDIQLGELEEAQPEVQLRPDCNKHYAVTSYEKPRDGELPIFVDLDALRDMESHAKSDTSVELGGVLLGGQYQDEDGNPFVVVTDSLRAKHFEATKGSFKFTHDTWAEISRERDEFPDDLQMVGWYHTHPDWGVFLSGMDMFICDNFFNRSLDLALVIDPCRNDRGMFQWTGEPRERIRRTSGFYLIASRFRQHELELYSVQLEGKLTMANDPRFGIAGQIGPTPAPVVNIAQSQSPWQGPALLAMLMMQFLLLAVIAWRVTVPAVSTDEDQDTAPSKQIVELEKKIDELVASRRLEDETKLESEIQTRVLERIASAMQAGDRGMVTSLEEQERRLARLESENRGYQALETVWITEQKDLLASLKSAKQAQDSLKKNYEFQKTQLTSKTQQVNDLKAENDALLDKIAKLTGEDPDSAGDGATKLSNPVVLGLSVGALLLVAVIGVAAGIWIRRRDELARFHELPEESNRDTNKSKGSDDGPPDSEPTHNKRDSE